MSAPLILCLADPPTPEYRLDLAAALHLLTERWPGAEVREEPAPDDDSAFIRTLRGRVPAGGTIILLDLLPDAGSFGWLTGVYNLNHAPDASLATQVWQQLNPGDDPCAGCDEDNCDGCEGRVPDPAPTWIRYLDAASCGRRSVLRDFDAVWAFIECTLFTEAWASVWWSAGGIGIPSTWVTAGRAIIRDRERRGAQAREAENERLLNGGRCVAELNVDVGRGSLLSDRLRAERAELVTGVALGKETIERLSAERDRLLQWVEDLQAGCYINCVYCGHRYGPDDEVPASMDDVLKAHIEKCPEHPLSEALGTIARLRTELDSALETASCAVCADVSEGDRVCWSCVDESVRHEVGGLRTDRDKLLAQGEARRGVLDTALAGWWEGHSDGCPTCSFYGEMNEPGHDDGCGWDALRELAEADSGRQSPLDADLRGRDKPANRLKDGLREALDMFGVLANEEGYPCVCGFDVSYSPEEHPEGCRWAALCELARKAP